MDNITATIRKHKDLQTCARLLHAADWENSFSLHNLHTVFAPVDDAFAVLPKAMMKSILEEKEVASQFLAQHIVLRKVNAAQLARYRHLMSIEGSHIMLEKGMQIRESVECSNGIVHVIEKIIIGE